MIMKLKKICKNPECNQEIKQYKSAKRLYCDDACKSRANYLKRLTEEYHLNAMDKAMRRNYQKSRELRDLDLGPISYQTLKSHGFDFDAIHKTEFFYDDNGNPVQLYHVYDIYFQLENNHLIFK
ncbi:hypothetical protein V8G56_04080 [Gaetbulibacter aquiaggeris]|uniref:Phage protein n=1 Tax=Gaetbulibacter aquiaggeris TaxID=1735373 RepID=A0ABW7MM61_9FLAO